MKERFFISGSNFFIDNHIKDIIKDEDDIESERYFGDELNRDEFKTFIYSSSMFGNDKIAYIRGFERSEIPFELLDDIQKSSYCSIVLSSNDSVKEINKKHNGFEKKLAELSFQLLIEEEKRNKIVSIADVVKVFRDKGLEIDNLTATEVLENTQNDFSAIENEAEKFSLFLADKSDKKVKNVIDNLSGKRTDTIYSLIDTFAERRVEDCLRVLDNINLNEDSNDFKVFFSIVKRVSNIYLAFISRDLINEYQDFVKRKVEDNKRHWKRVEAFRMINKLSKLDLEIKTGRKKMPDAIIEAINYNKELKLSTDKR